VHKQWEPAKGAFNDLVRVYPQKATHPPIIAYLAECDKNLSAKPQP
jgi:hypothetical protein